MAEYWVEGGIGCVSNGSLCFICVLMLVGNPVAHWPLFPDHGVNDYGFVEASIPNICTHDTWKDQKWALTCTEPMCIVRAFARLREDS